MVIEKSKAILLIIHSSDISLDLIKMAKILMFMEHTVKTFYRRWMNHNNQVLLAFGRGAQGVALLGGV